jgi:hypothetical protein
MYAIYGKHSINEFDRKMHSFFSLKITVSDVKDLGHNAWTLLKLRWLNKIKTYPHVEFNNLISIVFDRSFVAACRTTISSVFPTFS